MDRLAFLLRLLHGTTGRVMVLFVRSLLRLTFDPGEVNARCDLVGVGQEIDRDALAATLVRAA